jgi:hypothetical protein
MRRPFESERWSACVSTTRVRLSTRDVRSSSRVTDAPVALRALEGAGEVDRRVDALQGDRVQGRPVRPVVVKAEAAVRDSLDGVHDPGCGFVLPTTGVAPVRHRVSERERVRCDEETAEDDRYGKETRAARLDVDRRDRFRRSGSGAWSGH